MLAGTDSLSWGKAQTFMVGFGADVQDEEVRKTRVSAVPALLTRQYGSGLLGLSGNRLQLSRHPLVLLPAWPGCEGQGLGAHGATPWKVAPGCSCPLIEGYFDPLWNGHGADVSALAHKVHYRPVPLAHLYLIQLQADQFRSAKPHPSSMASIA
jgi:hypothetical protein